MPAMIDDEVLDAFAVVTEPDRVGAEVRARYATSWTASASPRPTCSPRTSGAASPTTCGGDPARPVRGALDVAVAAALWGTAGTVQELALPTASPVAVASVRCLLAGAVLLALACPGRCARASLRTTVRTGGGRCCSPPSR
jgi:hypothetical protein